MTAVPVPLTPSPPQLTAAQFQGLAEILPALEWFANLTNPDTRRAHQQDNKDFQAFSGPSNSAT
jgi:integrase/recombinase XerD